MDNEIIYLDNNSTTPLDKRVLDAMLPYFIDDFGNPSSTHNFGKKSSKAVNAAKKNISTLINSNIEEITFTSGATESINIALKGLALHPNNIKKHIVTVKTEHKAVLDTCKYLQTVGFEIDYLPVNNDGLIDLKQLENTIRKDTLLVCIMWVNNETGVIQPINEISELAHNAGSLFMTDATQAVGKIPTDVLENNIDIMCFSAHKMYGPKGIGALFVNSETVNKKNILPLQHGGGHENGLRSGTLNVPAIVGFGKACEIAFNEMKTNATTILSLRNSIENDLLNIKGSFVNGSINQRLYNTLNICLPNFDATVFIGKNKNIAVSNGSACNAALVEASHVLSAMGLSEDESLGSLRISIGKMNNESELKYYC
ncbi:cysteine desulfurase family protein [Flavobacterium sp.]|uniref:cysteine desulfurase family protein n=1 Tax=Flavobacterium sp. TaxID=239 RepID=UPI003753DADC